MLLSRDLLSFRASAHTGVGIYGIAFLLEIATPVTSVTGSQ